MARSQQICAAVSPDRPATATRPASTGKASYGTMLPTENGQTFFNVPRSLLAQRALMNQLAANLAIDGVDPETEYAIAEAAAAAGMRNVRILPGGKTRDAVVQDVVKVAAKPEKSVVVSPVTF